MSHFTFECTIEKAKKIAKDANFSTQTANNSKTFATSDDYRSIEWRNGMATITDASTANSSEIKEKYNVG
jgi:hypothetical protein